LWWNLFPEENRSKLHMGWIGRTIAAFGEKITALLIPPTHLDSSAVSFYEQQQQWRSRLLATFLLVGIGISLLLMPACFYVTAAYPLLSSVTVYLLFQLLGVSLNRRGHTRQAAQLYLGGVLAGAWIPLLFQPLGSPLPSAIIHNFLVASVVQSGFLLGPRASLWMGVFAVLTSGAHAGFEIGLYSDLYLHNGAEAIMLLGLLRIATLFSLTSLTWIITGVMEESFRKADRTQEMERLNAELEARNQAIHQQARALAELNGQLVAMQLQLEASYRVMEQANQQLEKLATTDTMTGLANHRMFQQTLRTQVAQANRYKLPLSLLLMDVDHFKKYNDEFGHPAGDQVLSQLGRILLDSVRAGDLAARYGGEEFAVLLPHTELATAVNVAERLRQLVAEHPFPHRAITLSVGVAALHVHAVDADGLVHLADRALYAAKRGGRNRVVVAPESIAAPSEYLSRGLDHPLAGSGEFPESTYVDTPPLSGLSLPIQIHDACGGVEGLVQEPAGILLTALLAALDMREAEEQGHSQRVARYALRLAAAVDNLYERQRAQYPLRSRITPGDLRNLALGALLHDIGKVGIPDHILHKPVPLTEEEVRIIRRHPVIGAELLYGLPVIAAALPVVLHHHERWDGQGYPNGLAGEEIPLIARIFAVCDALDSMTSARPYRCARPMSEAREEIRRAAGTQFDPMVVEAFLEIPETEWERLRCMPIEEQEMPSAA
jgi:diguanylate cyclase (GGDEF)-like protein